MPVLTLARHRASNFDSAFVMTPIHYSSVEISAISYLANGDFAAEIHRLGEFYFYALFSVAEMTPNGESFVRNT
jgi:hypothetical protein